MRAPPKEFRPAFDALARGDLQGAGRLLEKRLRAAPRHPVAHELMAYVAGRLGDHDAALRHLEVATAAPEASDTAWYYLGLAHARRREWMQAERALRSALRANPRFFEAAHDLGRVLDEQGRHADALAAFDLACDLDARSAAALHNRGRALASLGRFEEALACCDAALAIDGSVAETWLNRGEALHDLGRHREALESYRRAQELRSPFPETRANEAITLLASGDFEKGWAAFESRWEGSSASRARHRQLPRWHGHLPLEGKTLLVWAEQGMGDTIQFCRYVPLLRERGARIVLEVQPDLRAWLAQSLDCTVIGVGDAVPACDFQVPLMSLPFEMGTSLDGVPAAVPYLRVDAEGAARWATRLRASDGAMTVALACSGRSTYKHEGRRRIPLELFAGIAARTRLFVAQRELYPEDREALDQGRVKAQFLGDDMNDFRDAAAICQAVDLVISVDTALTHVAGALARPAWLLLSEVADWRWMVGRADSPWYPTVRILRCDSGGGWTYLVREVERRIAERAAG
jgi:Tfp pilus assembly protein PilF